MTTTLVPCEHDDGTSFPKPRPFQIKAHESLREGFTGGHKNQIIMAPTGAGKTYIGLNICNEATRRGKKAVFLCDRTTLINQTSVVADRYGMRHGIIQADHWRTRPEELLQIASVQTIGKRKFWPQMDVLVVDECFPADTLISTPQGLVEIHTIHSGDLIYNTFGIARVQSTFSKLSNQLCKVRLSDGTNFRCTTDHPIFTGMGWKSAGTLGVGEKLFCIQDMQSMWKQNFPQNGEIPKWKSESDSGITIQQTNDLWSILCKEIEKPYAQSIIEGQDARNIIEDWSQTHCSRGQWTWHDIATAINSKCVGGWMGRGICSENKEVSKRGLSIPLQAGFSQCGYENCHRIGRRKSSVIQAERTRFEEGCSSENAWVESVEIEESGSDEIVYNLRIEGHPSYFANGILVHNCHTTYKAWTEFAVETEATVIGLSATPFTVGLGKIFTNLVNATTMHDLTESGVLVPMRIFSCSKPDMEGAATAGGEWTDKAAEERELKIVGNVVLDWHKFGDNRKTIVFGATIKHCEELCRKFIESGVMAAVFTCETTAKEREALLDEYHKPNSHLKVLISVEALAKGFDCIAEGSEVLTHRGLVAIEKVLYNDKLWDGYEFVSHGGIIYKGERDVITYSGLTATEDHLVKTSTGWIPFGECARLGIPIVCTASGQRHIREDEGRFTNGNNKENHEGCITEPELPMRSVRISDTATREVVVDRSRVQEMLHAKSRAIMDSGKGKKHEGALRKLIAQGVQRLWGAWNRVQVRVTTTLCELDHGAYATTSQGQEYSIGSDRQQRSLRAGQHSLGEQESKLRKYAARWLGGENSQIQVQLSRNSLRGQNSEEFNINGNEFGRYSQPILQTFGQTKRRVWDVLNAGPRNSFTCEGLLVHNCADVGCICDARPLRKSLSTAIQMWGRGLRSSPETGKVDCHLLDFSGNIVRFFEDFSEVYFNGLDQLDDGNKLDKKIRTKEEFETKGCPKCGYSPFHKRCMSCGYERISRDVMDNVPGSMKEIFIGTGSNKKKLADNSKHLWDQLCSYARIHSKPEYQSGRAWHLFNKITGRETEWQFSTAPTVEVSKNVVNKIRQMNIAYRNATKIGA